jgi:hypothetical protein
LYTRDGLKNLADQLDSAKLGEVDEIKFPTLLGKPYSEPVNLGRVINIMSGVKTIMCVPRLHERRFLIELMNHSHVASSTYHLYYKPIQELVAGAAVPAGPSEEMPVIYAPMQLDCVTEHQDEETGAGWRGAIRINFPQSISEVEIGTLLLDEKERWERGPHGSQLIKTIRRTTKLPTIKRIVAFESGSMTWRVPNQKRATVHLSLVLLLRRLFCQLQGVSALKDLETFVQDPTYTTRDKSVLRQMGLKVVDDPNGFLAIDEETLVISIMPKKPVRQIVADIARPAMMVWAKVPDTPLPKASCHGMDGFESTLNVP